VRVVADLPKKLDIAPELEVVAYQVAREAILNAATYSKAKNVSLVLESAKDLVIRIEDDGVGFQPDAIDRTRHFGLSLVEERVGRVGGFVRIESSPGKGTRLLATIPGSEMYEEPRPK
jgi:protein-histidine pros-kinase